MIKNELDTLVDKFFKESKDEESAIRLIDDAIKNLYEVQKYLMRKRVQLYTIAVAYILVSLKVVVLNKIPGIDAEIKGSLFIFETLHSAVICIIPLIYVITHYLLVNSLLYRSQMRLIVEKGYKHKFAEIFRANLNIYSNPYSPGGNMKGINQLFAPTNEDGDSTAKSLFPFRTPVAYIEIILLLAVASMMVFHQVSHIVVLIKTLGTTESFWLLFRELITYIVVLLSILAIGYFGTLDMVRKYKND